MDNVKSSVETSPTTAPVAESTPTYAPIRGVTVGNLTGDSAVRVDALNRASRRRSVGSQSLAAVFFIAALVPAILVCLLFGLSHRIYQIPYSPVWSWAAVVISLFLALRASFIGRYRSTASGGFLPLIGIVVLLLVPSVTVLYLQRVLHPTSFSLALAQMLLYGISTVALLMFSLSFASVE
jgi:hypothetical protein